MVEPYILVGAGFCVDGDNFFPVRKAQYHGFAGVYMELLIFQNIARFGICRVIYSLFQGSIQIGCYRHEG